MQNMRKMRQTEETGNTLRRLDPELLAATSTLVVLGLMFACSASVAPGLRCYDAGVYCFKRQLLYTLGSIALAVAAARYGTRLRSGSGPLWFLAAAWAVLGLPLFFDPIAGGYRWLRLGGYVFQPSAFTGPALILYLSLNLAAKKGSAGLSSYNGPLAVIAGTLSLTALSGDLGALFVLFCTALFMLAAGGMRKVNVAFVLFAIALCLLLELLRYPYRLIRVLSFWNSTQDPLTTGYQTAQAKIFMVSGGFFGGVPGGAMPGLPGFHTDYAFAGLAANLGWVAALSAAAGVGYIVFRAIRLAGTAGSRAEKLLASGIAFYISTRALLHAFKCFGFLPPNSIPFPFISYGGSDLAAMLLLVTLLHALAPAPAGD